MSRKHKNHKRQVYPRKDTLLSKSNHYRRTLKELLESKKEYNYIICPKCFGSGCDLCGKTGIVHATVAERYTRRNHVS